jgi:hypothetical protein
MPQDHETLKRELAAIFNQVSPRKVVQVNEVVANFDNLTGSNFGLFERGPVKDKVHAMVHKVPAAPGVFVDNTSTYVTPEFLKQGMLQAVDRGDTDGHEDVAKRMAQTAVQAVQRSTDQTPRVNAGLIKPKTQ